MRFPFRRLATRCCWPRERGNGWLTFSSRVHGREEEEKTKSHHLVTKVLFFYLATLSPSPTRPRTSFSTKHLLRDHTKGFNWKEFRECTRYHRFFFHLDGGGSGGRGWFGKSGGRKVGNTHTHLPDGRSVERIWVFILHVSSVHPFLCF